MIYPPNRRRDVAWGARPDGLPDFGALLAGQDEGAQELFRGQEQVAPQIAPQMQPQMVAPNEELALPSLAPQDPSAISGSVREGSQDEQIGVARDNYNRALGPPRKEKAWKEAVWLGLQGLQKVFSPEMNTGPIRLLRDVQRDREIARTGQILGAETQQRDVDLGAESKRTQIENYGADNRRADAEQRRKEVKDAEQVKYWARKADQGDLKLANDAELITLRDKWATSKDKNDERRLNLVEAEMKNRMERSDKDRASREKLFGLKTEADIRKATVISQLRDKSEALSKALADKNNAASQARAKAIQQEMITLRATLDQ